MRTRTREKKNGPLRPNVRSLKIHERMRENQYGHAPTSEIKLCGNWLEQLGFQHGKRITVTMMNELLIIRLQPE